jgi:hypothetical protein
MLVSPRRAPWRATSHWLFWCGYAGALLVVPILLVVWTEGIHAAQALHVIVAGFGVMLLSLAAGTLAGLRGAAVSPPCPW